LKTGDKVIVKWTNSFNIYSAPAIVSKINSKSFRVKLTGGIKGLYPVGQEFPVPRFLGSGWSDNNRVFPLG